jgi:glycerol kinase
MRKPVVLAVDQGTTSVRAAVLAPAEGTGGLRGIAARGEGVARTFPRPGWVELDAEEVVAATERVMAEALAEAGCSAGDVAGVGLANQGETVVVWEREGGRPIAPAVVWQCRRTEEVCARLREDGSAARWVREVTGLSIDPYFSATKLAWILDEVPGARARAARGELCAGTLDTYTLFRLSGGKLHVTDPSTACRTLLARLDDGRFSEELCSFFGVPFGMLAEVVPSDAAVGPIRIGVGGGGRGGGQEAMVRALLCDQPSALLGTGCLARGDLKCTYGTGAFLQVNTGGRPEPGEDGLLRSIAWEIGAERTYLLEGSVLAAGDVLAWLCDGLGMLARPEEVDDVLARTPDAGGVLFAPALTGLGAPRWVGEARGTILGLHRGTRREHLIRAALEGVAHQVADVLDIAARVAPGGVLWADGGLAASKEFLALQAGIAGRPLRRAAEGEATTRGVAALAAVGAGMLPSLAAAVAGGGGEVVEPRMDERTREAARAVYRRLLDVATSKEVLEVLGGERAR